MNQDNPGSSSDKLAAFPSFIEKLRDHLRSCLETTGTFVDQATQTPSAEQRLVVYVYCFNRIVPVKDGQQMEAIKAFARQQGFELVAVHD